MTITIEELLAMLPKAFLPEKAAGVDALVRLNIVGDDGGDWSVTIKDQKCSIVKEALPNPKLTLSATADDLIEIFSGRLMGTQAFMTGRLKLTGDTGLAMRLMNFFKVDR
ncbi:MAG TPA: SCP2 sterol-binding domain-containing protein [Longilinea sp.]|nr:SCP2 sterol-binding domain-containing protein [Longilinea sp.]